MICRLIDEQRGAVSRDAVVLVFAMLLLVTAIVPPCVAQDNLYTVTVPLDPLDPQAQQNAYKDALDRVLIRVTGSTDPVELEDLDAIFSTPSQYVLRFRARGQDKLEVSFDGDAIVELLRQRRHTIWVADRPLTMVWLAVDWGRGEREILAADTAARFPDGSRSVDRNAMLRERVEETARRRGIPILLPLLDTEDREKVSFGDIWGGFDQRLLKASKRYGASSILAGRVRIDSSGQNRWTYYFADEKFSWLGEPEEVIDKVADTLAALFAIRGDAVLDTYSLTVDGIDSLQAYGRVQQLIDNLGVVEDFRLKSVIGNKIEYAVSIYGDIERLDKALTGSGMLAPIVMSNFADYGAEGKQSPVEFSDPTRLEFSYLP